MSQAQVLSLGLIIKQIELKYNNVFLNKLVSMRLDVITNNNICLYVYIYN